MGFKFAVVEDAGFVRSVLKSCFADFGGECIFETGSGVLTAEQNDQLDSLDVMVIDFVLPDRNGIELAGVVRERSPHTILVGCSSLDAEAILAQAKAVGFFKVLAKPFAKTQIRDLLIELGLISQIHHKKDRGAGHV